MKRAFDFALTFLGLVALAPIILFLMLLVRLKLGAPIFFAQTRPGLHGKPFKMVKFRTMRDIKDAKGELLPDAERMTQLGSWLRSSSLDELPELWNVLKGEMSLVGPRPLLMEYLPLYSPEQARRHEVKPGITGWAQINGRNAISWAERFKLDVWYVDNHSILLDVKILWMTVSRVMRRSGITQEGHVTMEKFRGENSGEARK